MTEEIGVVRRLLQDLLTPQVASLEVKVSGLADRCSNLASEIEGNRSEILKLWQYVGQEFGTVRERVSRVEGRFEGVKEELAAKIQLHLTSQFPPEAHPPQLPPTDPPAT